MRRATLFTTAVASAFLLLSLLGPWGSQRTRAQTILPACQQELTRDYVFPSPRYDQDETMFWINVSESLLWRSQDNGQTWQLIFTFAPDLFLSSIEQFQMTPHNADGGITLYLGVQDLYYRQYHLFRSEQTGDVWEERTAACSAVDLDCSWFSLRAAGQANVLFQPRWWYFDWSPLPFGIARSEDGGQSWQMIWEETNAWSVAVSSDYDNDQTIWATLLGNSQTLGNDFILSHDGGETWQTAGQGLCYTSMLNSHLQVSPGYARDHTLLISFYDNSLFQSRDGGLTWRAIFPWGSTAACDHSLTQVGGLIPHFAPNYPDDPTIYLATRDGLYASYDDGLSWRRLTVSGTVFSLEVARGASASTIGSMSADETVSGAPSGADSNAALHQVFLPRVDALGTPIPTKPYSLFMHAYVAGTYNDYMYRSDDGGATWQCMEKPQVRRRAYLPLVSATQTENPLLSWENMKLRF